jgi:xanthine dehydrogenase iron-sulfur cluster and FAD-binding subunit A
MTDLRGSEAYRRAMIGRLLEKFFVDTAPNRPSRDGDHPGMMPGAA